MTAASKRLLATVNTAIEQLDDAMLDHFRVVIEAHLHYKLTQGYSVSEAEAWQKEARERPPSSGSLDVPADRTSEDS